MKTASSKWAIILMAIMKVGLSVTAIKKIASNDSHTMVISSQEWAEVY